MYRKSRKVSLFWVPCLQVLGHNLKNLYHTKLTFNPQKLESLIFLWLNEKRDLRMSWGIPGCRSIGVASFSIFFVNFWELWLPYLWKCGPNDLNFSENMRCERNVLIIEEFLYCWHSQKKWFFRKFEKKTHFWPSLGIFTPSNVV